MADQLDAYRRKRRFSRTPEPEGPAPRRAPGDGGECGTGRFVVEKVGSLPPPRRRREYAAELGLAGVICKPHKSPSVPGAAGWIAVCAGTSHHTDDQHAAGGRR